MHQIFHLITLEAMLLVSFLLIEEEGRIIVHSDRRRLMVYSSREMSLTEEVNVNVILAEGHRCAQVKRHLLLARRRPVLKPYQCHDELQDVLTLVGVALAADSNLFFVPLEVITF